VLNVEIPSPIRAHEYDEAITRYGSDRPDLRYGMELHDITDLAAQHGLWRVQERADGEGDRGAGRGEAVAQGDGCAGEWSKGLAEGAAVTR